MGLPLLWTFTDTPAWLLLATAAAWAAGAAMDRAGASRTTLAKLGSPVVGLFLALAVADLLFSGRDLFSALAFLLLGVQAVKLLLPKRAADGWQLSAVSLLEFLAAAATTERLSFAPSAFLFLSASAGAMWALHVQAEDELGRPVGGYDLPASTAAWALLLAGAFGFLATAVLFAAVPRVDLHRGLRRFPRGEAIPGFSETIALREVTVVKGDRRVVARVEFPFLGPGLSPPRMYLRGAVYSRYAGGEWRMRHTGVSIVPNAGILHLPEPAPSGPYSVADIVLEPADHPRLFTYGTPAMIEGIPGPLLTDAEGNLSLAHREHPTMRYRIRFAPALPAKAGVRSAPGPEYLAFPAGYEDVRELARSIVGTGGTGAERASRILSFFRTGFRYTLSDPAPSLRRFLFDEKAGFCEHYAAGLALLLRGAGIAARVAAGYLGGEWNRYGQYLIVRQSDAHAWVEAWIDGRWVTLDATPPQNEGSPFFRRTGFLGLHVDWMRQRWDKYVVNYSMRTQAAAVARGWSTIRRSRAAIANGLAGRALAAVAGTALAGSAVGWLLWYRRRRGRGRTKTKQARLPAPYGRLLRTLERSGYRTSPGLAMEALLAAAVEARPDLAGDAALFLAAYHRDRFGPVPPDPELRADAFGRAERLRMTLLSPGIGGTAVRNLAGRF